MKRTRALIATLACMAAYEGALWLWWSADSFAFIPTAAFDSVVVVLVTVTAPFLQTAAFPWDLTIIGIIVTILFHVLPAFVIYRLWRRVW